MCSRDDDPTQHDADICLHDGVTDNSDCPKINLNKYLKVDITIDNTQIILGDEYIITTGTLTFHGKVLGIKTDARGNDLSIYILCDHIGEIGISVKDIETIMWVTNSI